MIVATPIAFIEKCKQKKRLQTIKMVMRKQKKRSQVIKMVMPKQKKRPQVIKMVMRKQKKGFDITKNNGSIPFIRH